MVDLGKLDVVKGAEKCSRMFLKNPATDQELEIFFDVLGKDSKVFKQAERKVSLKVLNNKVLKNKKEITEEYFDITADNELSLLSEVVTGFGIVENGKEYDYILVDDKKIKYSKETTIELLERFPFMREQITAFIGDRANFLAK